MAKFLNGKYKGVEVKKTPMWYCEWLYLNIDFKTLPYGVRKDLAEVLSLPTPEKNVPKEVKGISRAKKTLARDFKRVMAYDNLHDRK